MTLRSGKYAVLRRLHLGMDAAIVVLSMWMASWAHVRLRPYFSSLKAAAAFHEHALLVILALPLWAVLVYALGLHRSFERVWGRIELSVELAKLHFVGLVGLTTLQFLTQSVINRSLVALFLGCSFAAMYAQRRVLNAWTRFQHAHGYGQERFVLIGEPSQRMRDFTRHVLTEALPPRLIGYLHEEEPSEPTGRSVLPGGLPWLGTPAELERVLQENSVDHVLFFSPYNRADAVPRGLLTCESLGIPASFAVDLVHLPRIAPRVVTVAQRPFVTFDEPPERGAGLAVKYGLDPILAAILLVVLSPLLLVTALAILLMMGRPIFFAQERAGLYGRAFRMLKFRSMSRDAESKKHLLQGANEMTGPTFKMTNDPRVTPLGRFLRRSSIDELPQLINVVMGTMSLVGPRPLPLSEQDQILGFRRRRLSMKPGITGLWQVSGRSNLSFDEWMALDLQYIDEWSLALDAQILLKTIPTVLLSRGAR